MKIRRSLLSQIERLDSYMHVRWRWSPSAICDLTELAYGVPADEPHHWRKGRPSRVARAAFRLLTRGQ